MINKKYGIVKAFVLAVLVLVSGFSYSCGQEPDPVLLEQTGEAAVGEAAAGETGGAKTAAEEIAESEAETLPPCYVHVCGEVVRPGVYEMEPGQRVCRAVELAGGYTDRAAADYLNLAETVQDGMKLVVPDRESLAGEASGSIYGEADSQGGAPGSAKVNINTADKERLMTLKGIGEAKAEDIIHYREEYGRFERIEDIMNISGIKEAAFQKIKEDVTV